MTTAEEQGGRIFFSSTGRSLVEEDEMRGGRPDIHPDAENDEFVFIDQRAPGAREENAAALRFLVGHRAGQPQSEPCP